MTACIIFGGAGYIGTKLSEYLLSNKICSTVYILDLKESPLKNNENVICTIADVRNPISTSILKHPVEWIFNFAAIHREPGHESQEYFETNIKGATNICQFAEKVGCSNIFFTSSISPYGPTLKATDESILPMPNTPYGISKLSAEFIHKLWQSKNISNRLIIVRPGVIYGPGDPGNILRMIKAVKKGYFFLPVNPTIKKSYGYVFGLFESIVFMINQPEKVITYNYVEQETLSLGGMISTINKVLGTNGKVIRIPLFALKIAANILHKIKPNLNGIHPERVKKVARPTHILPNELIKRGFTFNYDFEKSLIHWKKISSTDFG
ncbi:MAG: NAD(P)-dependent oxidoreductase [Bacteroidetes bacterium]|nr:MAG: NAD(P)-dependent oxidoreductase [Bacteroidota bacterium]